MKIALVLSPSLFKRCPLIGLGYLSAYLEERGHEVSIFDLNAQLRVLDEYDEEKWRDKAFVDRFILENSNLFEPMCERILQSGSEIIGFSVWATTHHSSMALAKIIKQKDPNRLIVFGGPECSFEGYDLAIQDMVDVVICGEGEAVFVEIADMYERKRKIYPCPGILLEKNGDVVNRGHRTEIESLDSLPFPDYSKFPHQRYYNPNTFSMMFHRGCLRRCVFCNTAVTWKKFRSRSAESIYKEMSFHIERYPDLEKIEVDDTALNLNLAMLSRLCDLILTNGLKINWAGSALVRAEMNSRLIKRMQKAGCSTLGYGLESGSQKIVDRMGKGFKIEDAERLIRDTHNAGILTILGIVIGFPGETDKDFQDTLDFIKRNKDFITRVNFPSECCIGSRGYMIAHPDQFDVILSPDSNGERWRSKDGANTHETRQERRELFNQFLDSLGVISGNYVSVENAQTRDNT